MFALFKKYKELLLYVLFGTLTTLVNIVSFFLFYNMLQIGNVPSNILAWILSVLFAFITNKLFVFESRSFRANIVLKEALSFFWARLLTGVLDVVIMYFAVDVFSLNSTLCKLASNVLVILLNYIFSKVWIFKR